MMGEKTRGLKVSEIPGRHYGAKVSISVCLFIFPIERDTKYRLELKSAIHSLGPNSCMKLRQ